MKTKAPCTDAHLDFRGNICEKKCTFFTNTYGIIIIIVNIIIIINIIIINIIIINAIIIITVINSRYVRILVSSF